MNSSPDARAWCFVAAALLFSADPPAVSAQENSQLGGSFTSRQVITESQSSSSPTAGQVGSSEVTFERKGVMGVRGSNVFRPKYRERLKTYAEQIELGTSKGWLTTEEGERFKKELARLDSLEAEASKHGWPKAELDDVERAFTQFNIDLHKASNKPAAPTPARPAEPVKPAQLNAKPPAADSSGAAPATGQPESNQSVPKPSPDPQ
ncbi:MAG TPA: hypothetical protein V6D08_09055 [Candidatus Obscuribacterales bacterium]